MQLFLGKPPTYWIELQLQVDNSPDCFNTERLLAENGKLRAKVSFYESRIVEMGHFGKLFQKEPAG